MPLGTVAVTGASGFIGRHIADEASRRGHRVIYGGLRRGGNGPEWRLGDLREVADARRFLDGVDTVFHCAALVGTLLFKMSNPAVVMTDNLRMTMTLLEACALAGTRRVILFSSAEVYVGDHAIFSEENGFDGEPSPGNAGYVWSKRMSEKAAQLAAQQYGFDLAVIRPNNIFGPGDDYALETARAIPAMIARGLAGEDLVVWGDGSQRRSFLYIDDLVDASLEIAERGLNQGAINLSATEEVSLYDLALTVSQLAGARSRILLDDTKPAGPGTRRISVDKAVRLIGYAPQISLRQGIERCIDDLRAAATPRMSIMAFTERPSQ